MQETGDGIKFAATVAEQFAIYLIGQSVSNSAIRSLRRGMREDEIARRTRRAVEALINAMGGNLIEAMHGVINER